MRQTAVHSSIRQMLFNQVFMLLSKIALWFVVSSGDHNKLSVYHGESNNDGNKYFVRDPNKETMPSCSNIVIQVRLFDRVEISITWICLAESDAASPEDTETASWCHLDSTMVQLTGNFSLAMDIWTDGSGLDAQPTIDEDSPETKSSIF